MAKNTLSKPQKVVSLILLPWVAVAFAFTYSAAAKANSKYESMDTYLSVAERTSIPAKGNRPAASYYSFSYRSKEKPLPTRPVTFLFNGGPGSASHWLHLGGFGPQRINLNSHNQPAYQIVKNPNSLLATTDLVFIDPIGTGFSIAEPNTAEKTQAFWGVVSDAKSTTNFILTWLQQHNRTNSPVFIVGESYGTLRATLIADELSRVHQQSVNGLVLLSAVQNYRNIRTPDGSVMGHISYLPTYAATAWHHKKTGHQHAGFETFIKDAQQFAEGGYANALIRGNRLSNRTMLEIAGKFAYFTGLPTPLILKSNLRIQPLDYLRLLLKDDSKKVSRLDSRMVGAASGTKKNQYGQDPYATLIRQPFVAATQTYLNDTLNVPTSLGKYIDSARENPGWNWDWNVWGKGNIPSGARYINVIPNLERTLKTNPSMRVMVAAGYYDFATPFASAENAFSELDAGADRIAFHHYQAGHIIYLDNDSRAKLSRDIQLFIEKQQ